MENIFYTYEFIASAIVVLILGIILGFALTYNYFFVSFYNETEIPKDIAISKKLSKDTKEALVDFFIKKLLEEGQIVIYVEEYSDENMDELSELFFKELNNNHKEINFTKSQIFYKNKPCLYVEKHNL